MKRVGGGLSHREIGKLLGISRGTVANIEKRALEKMAAIARQERMLCAELFESLSQEGADREEEGKLGGEVAQA